MLTSSLKINRSPTQYSIYRIRLSTKFKIRSISQIWYEEAIITRERVIVLFSSKPVINVRKHSTEANRVTS